MSARRPVLLLLAAAVAMALAAAPVQAAPKRVVALDWDVVENLVALGVTPVGAADLGDYRTYVAIRIPGAITDVGTRQEPSIERIAKLKPDLIVLPDNRVGRNLATLKKIAKVLVTHPYDGDHFAAMQRDFRALGRAVGKPARADAVLRDMNATFTSLRKRLKSAHRAGVRVTVATPGGTPSSPALRLFTSNSSASAVLGKLGLRNAWTAAPARFGFSTVGVEALRRVQTGWLAFVYPAPFVSQIKRFTAQGSYKRLEMVRKKRVRNLGGNTWLFGGPLSSKVLAQRLTETLT
jgi:iron complex transport system substrate-binding protein